MRINRRHFTLWHYIRFLGILNGTRGRVKILLEPRKQLSTSVLIITTGLPFKSASDTPSAISFEALLRYLLLTFKPPINLHAHQTILQSSHACEPWINVTWRG